MVNSFFFCKYLSKPFSLEPIHPNFLILSDRNIKLSNLEPTNTTHYSLNILKTINLNTHSHIDHI